MAVAINQPNGFKPFSRSHRCSLQSFTHLDYNFLEVNKETENFACYLNQACEDENIHRSSSTPCFSVAGNMEDEFQTTNKPRIEILGGRRVPLVRALVAEAAIAMVSGVQPSLLASGLGGAYLLKTKNGNNVAVVKPIDEEPFACNNPKGFKGLMLGQPGMKGSIRVGETGIRELAAYLLDHNGFSGIPPTALVRISHVPFHVTDVSPTVKTSHKIASIQRFVDHDFDAGELGPSGFSVASVHQIGIFDVRVLNLDRHAGNMLVKKCNQIEGYGSVGSTELVPIDHGLCLPECLDDPYFEWLHWPQSSVPFTEFELQYISELDPFKDAELLRSELPSLEEPSLRVLMVCTIFLKHAANAGLCLAEIGKMMTRDACSGEENCSILETICSQARASVYSNNGYDENEDDEESNNHSDEESESESETFQFDDEPGEPEGSLLEINPPRLFQFRPDYHMSKPPMIPKVPSINTVPAKICGGVLSSTALRVINQDAVMIKEDIDDDEDGDDGGDKDGEDKSWVGCAVTRSKSCTLQGHVNQESSGVSFGDMTKSEWEKFLKGFEKLILEASELFKCNGSKQRLGSSCDF